MSEQPPPAAAKAAVAAPKSRSVNDFDTASGVRAALKNQTKTCSFAGHRDFPRALIGSSLGVPRDNDDDDMSECSTVYCCANDDDDAADWLLTNHEPESSEVQTLEHELNRLQVLKSYLILDVEREANFERLTSLAARMFSVPIALVSLVDLGRQWFLSNRGLGDVRETPRKLAFCAHAILSKHDLLIVPNALEDARFGSNPLVTGPPHIRFYAGAPLLCPEGYKLGTLCLIDTKVRPEGLSLDDKQSLREMAALVVDAMVERRRERMRILQDKSQIIATTAHDLLTPLSGLQMSLSLLYEEQGEQDNYSMPPAHRELLETAVTCGNVMQRICNTAIETFRGDSGGMDNYYSSSSPTSSSSPSSSNNNKKGPKTIVVSEMVKSLNMVMGPFPKSVPLFISVDPLVPPQFVSDDLKVFRSAVNFLTNALTQTTRGNVHLKIYIAGRKQKPKLVFECEDTGPGIALEQYPFLFRPPPFRRDEEIDEVEEEDAPTGLEDDQCIRVNTSTGKVEAGCPPNQGGNNNSNNSNYNGGLGLYSVANQISSIGGEYGFRPRDIADQQQQRQQPSTDGNDDGGAAANNKQSGSIFWFSIPLIVPNTLQEDAAEERSSASQQQLQQHQLRNHNSKNGNTSNGGSHGGSSAATTHGHSTVRVVSTSKLNPIDAAEIYTAVHKLLAMEVDDAHDPNMNNPAAAATLSSSPTAAASIILTNGGHPMTTATTSSTITSTTTTSIATVPSSNNTQHHTRRVRRALVIDDSLVIRKSMSKALAKLGFHVTIAVNGLEGLKQLQSQVFDVVLCDYLMPVMDGLDCVQQYRDWEEAHRPWFRQYIVGISAHASGSDVEKGRRAGMNDFQPKPVTMKNLKELERSEELQKIRIKLDSILSLEHTSATMNN